LKLIILFGRRGGVGEGANVLYARASYIYTYAVFVESDGLQVRVKQQLFGVNVDWRLSLAFTAQVPFRIDQPPEFRP